MLKHISLAVISGLFLALAWPTYGLCPLIFIAFVPLLWADYQLREQYSKNNFRAFLLAFIAFVIWNGISTWWIWNATPAGGVFAIIVNTLLMTLVFMLYHWIAKRRPLRFSLIAFSGLWIGFEKFHHHWDFSWPWLTLGNVFSERITWIQWYEYTGIFGGSLWVLLINAMVFTALVTYLQSGNRKYFIKQLIAAASLVAIGILISQYIYLTYDNKGETIEAIALQPNTNPYTEKYNRSHTEIANELIRLALPDMSPNTAVVLAPETVFSTKVTTEEFENSQTYGMLNQFIDRYPNTDLLMGIDLYKIYSDDIPRSKTANSFSNTASAWYESYNGAFFLSRNNPVEYYHKSKLVVGVELFPYRRFFKPLLGNVMIDLGGTVSTLTPQKEPSVFTLSKSDVKIAPVICYESIYGEFMGKYTKKGAEIFGIVTNDSWWGRTQGYQQLLSYARLRAIEHRRSIVRSANSGVSAFINQKGEVISRLDYEIQGALKGQLQVNKKLTLYSRQGDFVARIMAFVGILFALAAFFVPRKKAGEE
ncbi:MAG: apolipoprotein N-acyltransferase [Flavobacteriia bacterium]|nr:MAG: apolipoprotein N-acyltransferase [Flavobacteriia bacterium]